MFGNQAHQIQLLKFNQNIMRSSSHHVNTKPTDGQKAKNIYEQTNHTFPFKDRKCQHSLTSYLIT